METVGKVRKLVLAEELAGLPGMYLEKGTTTVTLTHEWIPRLSLAQVEWIKEQIKGYIDLLIHYTGVKVESYELKVIKGSRVRLVLKFSLSGSFNSNKDAKTGKGISKIVIGSLRRHLADELSKRSRTIFIDCFGDNLYPKYAANFENKIHVIPHSGWNWCDIECEALRKMNNSNFKSALKKFLVEKYNVTDVKIKRVDLINTMKNENNQGLAITFKFMEQFSNFKDLMKEINAFFKEHLVKVINKKALTINLYQYLPYGDFSTLENHAKLDDTGSYTKQDCKSCHLFHRKHKK